MASSFGFGVAFAVSALPCVAAAILLATIAETKPTANAAAGTSVRLPVRGADDPVASG
jgi:hypothetical protein